jgi:hypothetical protein
MAIDTLNKRRSAASTKPWHRVAPVPDGVIGFYGDTCQIAGNYRGLIIEWQTRRTPIRLGSVTGRRLDIAGLLGIRLDVAAIRGGRG